MSDFVQDAIRMLAPIGEPYLEFTHSRNMIHIELAGKKQVVQVNYEYDKETPANHSALRIRKNLCVNDLNNIFMDRKAYILLNPIWRKYANEVLMGLTIATLIRYKYDLHKEEIVFDYPNGNDQLEKYLNKYKVHLKEILIKKERQRQKLKEWRDKKKGEKKSAEIISIEDRLLEETGISNVNLSGMAKNLAEVVAETLIMLSKSFHSRLVSVEYKERYSSCLAHVKYCGEIVLFYKWFKDGPEKISTREAREIIAHEYAHTITNFTYELKHAIYDKKMNEVMKACKNNCPDYEYTWIARGMRRSKEYDQTIINIKNELNSEVHHQDHSQFHQVIKGIHVKYLSLVSDAERKMCRILRSNDLGTYNYSKKAMNKMNYSQLISIADYVRGRGTFKGEPEFAELERYLASLNLKGMEPHPRNSINEFFACAFASNYDSNIPKPSTFATEVLEATKKYSGKDAQKMI